MFQKHPLVLTELIKFPYHRFAFKPCTTREYSNHPDHTNIANYPQVTLPCFPQYILNQFDSYPEPNNFVDEHVLIPTPHWTTFYNFTNPHALPRHNTTHDIERNKSKLFRLTKINFLTTTVLQTHN